MLVYKNIDFLDLSAYARISSFVSENGANEFHIMVELTDKTQSTEIQFECLREVVRRLKLTDDLKDTVLVLKRYFVSDAINQSRFLMAAENEAVSIVQQPPLNGTKASLWLYFVSDSEIKKETGQNAILKRPTHEHIFHTQLFEREKDVNIQTDTVFENYIQDLDKIDCTLKDNCVRTWIYVQDVDVQYAGMVHSRKYFFENEGLTSDTHYIASTGIEGRYIFPDVLMLMDAYAVTNLKPNQMKYLYAPTHLNPTYEYGVTFERGTTVDYGDRRHVFISGTASIDNKGEIVHPLNITKQTERTFENIQALLSEANAEMNDIAKMIVYLRDTADYDIVSQYVEKHYPEIPKVMVWAPVCRPGWLIEIECIALKAVENPQFDNF